MPARSAIAFGKKGEQMRMWSAQGAIFEKLLEMLLRKEKLWQACDVEGDAVSWSIGWDTRWQRDIGYGVPAYCDFPGCMEEIDRGLSYVCCGEQPYGGEHGCGLYFCEKHGRYYKWGHGGVCSRCFHNREPYKPSSEHPDWIKHKATDASWSGWRKDRKLEFK